VEIVVIQLKNSAWMWCAGWSW